MEPSVAIPNQPPGSVIAPSDLVAQTERVRKVTGGLSSLIRLMCELASGPWGSDWVL